MQIGYPVVVIIVVAAVADVFNDVAAIIVFCRAVAEAVLADIKVLLLLLLQMLLSILQLSSCCCWCCFASC